jgi:hypothetical protein
MIAELRGIIGNRSLRQCQAEWGVDFREISAVLRARQNPGERLLALMGLRADTSVHYVRVGNNGELK